ncbi:glycosyltransferase family 2 protein [Plectonema radiosum NIES-515]|uniref:Glycosyltransferase family 2 protein n=1 Tax=Plectonema radiosum NIES-515 TaxID=2986073 RepID=A0ABT3B5S9_9CYAN|nr:glycosyltransferase family 2 protein [Plectonema radiosum]MCV3216723.1 glycosyltransferase family 2 protein [Plectonema radiosum NIES-515]
MIANMQNLSFTENYNVAAYITAYEDPEAVRLCVEAINSQSFPVQKILIVDNSHQKPISGLDGNNAIIKYCPENIGIALGLSWAITWAIEQDYDFLWAFDQDSIIETECLIKLLSIYKNHQKDNYLIGIIAPTAVDLRNNQIIEGAIFQRDRFVGCKASNEVQPYECDSPITSGSLISIRAAKTISPPIAELFIDGVDLDYGLRLVQKGFHNLIVPDAIMHHNFGNPIKAKFFSRELTVQKYSALRHYYICRNHTYLSIRYAQRWYSLTSCMRRMKYMIYSIVLIWLYDSEHKALKTWACILGTCHGLIGRLGKIW